MLSTTRAGTVGTPTFVGLCLVGNRLHGAVAAGDGYRDTKECKVKGVGEAPWFHTGRTRSLPSSTMSSVASPRRSASL